MSQIVGRSFDKNLSLVDFQNLCSLLLLITWIRERKKRVFFCMDNPIFLFLDRQCNKLRCKCDFPERSACSPRPLLFLKITENGGIWSNMDRCTFFSCHVFFVILLYIFLPGGMEYNLLENRIKILVTFLNVYF